METLTPISGFAGPLQDETTAQYVVVAAMWLAESDRIGPSHIIGLIPPSKIYILLFGLDGWARSEDDGWMDVLFSRSLAVKSVVSQFQGRNRI
jgi:hypothetical protein